MEVALVCHVITVNDGNHQFHRPGEVFQYTSFQGVRLKHCKIIRTSDLRPPGRPRLGKIQILNSNHLRKN